jgi:hypothetical protein
MKTTKSLGVFMDHQSANLIKFTEEPMQPTIIECKFTHQSKEESLAKNEKLMHNKEQQQQHDYYMQLCKVIKEYSQVLLFGPTNAKTELHNLLKLDHNFDNIKIEVLQSDKLTNNQQHAIVHNHFANMQF